MQSSKTVLCISSHVARGHVGNAAMVFAFQRLGVDVIDVPTVILPFHPGHGPGTRIPVSGDGFAGLLDDLCRHKGFERIDAVISGYLAEPDQAGAIAMTVDLLKKKNPAAIYCCDPVIGDGASGADGRLYVDQAIAIAVRDMLIPRADVITPNAFELSWLTGEAASDNIVLASLAGRLGADIALVTSAFPMMRDHAATLAVTKERALIAEGRAVAQPPHGIGDLLAALFLFHHLSGRTLDEGLRKAVASVHDLAMQTVRLQRDELPLVAEQHRLIQTPAVVQLRQLVF